MSQVKQQQFLNIPAEQHEGCSQVSEGEHGLAPSHGPSLMPGNLVLIWAVVQLFWHLKPNYRRSDRKKGERKNCVLFVLVFWDQRLSETNKYHWCITDVAVSCVTCTFPVSWVWMFCTSVITSAQVIMHNVTDSYNCWKPHKQLLQHLVCHWKNAQL